MLACLAREKPNNLTPQPCLHLFTYSHANTPLGQSERAYYLSYFIKLYMSLNKYVCYVMFCYVIGEYKESFKSFRTLLSLSKQWNLHAHVIFLQYLLKMIVLLFSQSWPLSVHQRLIKRIRTNYVKKNTFFHFSVKDLVNFSKNSNDTGPT